MTANGGAGDQLSQLFRSCDRQGRGHIGCDEFLQLCEGLDIQNEEAHMIFQDLDREGKGRITYQDFAWGFREFVGDSTPMRDGVRGRYGAGERASETHTTWTQLASALGISSLQIAHMKNGQQLVALYQELQSVNGSPQLIRSYTTLIKALVQEFTDLQEGNRRWEQLLMREKKTHMAQLHGLEEEVDDQLEQVVSEARAEARAEARVEARAEARAQWEAEREALEGEKSDLQARLQVMQFQLDTVLSPAECRARRERGGRGASCQECRSAWLQVALLHRQLRGARAEILELKAEEDEGRASLHNLRSIVEMADSDLSCYENDVSLPHLSDDSGVVSLRDELSSQTSQNEELVAARSGKIYKVVFAGDSAVGKSCFIHRFIKGVFVNNLGTTLGVDFHQKSICVDKTHVILQLWDTAGQERFRAMTKSYFRRADGVVLLYDIGNEKSFQNVRQWVDTIQDVSDKRIPVVLCGNKADRRREELGVRIEDGFRLAQDHQVLFYETSSRLGTNIKEAMLALAREMVSCSGAENLSTVSESQVVLKKPAGNSGSCC